MSIADLKIRRAQPGDMDRLTSLLKLLFAIEADFTFDEKRQQQGLNLLLQSNTCCIMVADIGGEVVGMCTGQLLISTAEGGPALWVEDVVVAEEYRRQGIGSMLLDGLAEWAREQGAFRMQLLADLTNKAGLDFYCNKGWQQTQCICLRKWQKK